MITVKLLERQHPAMAFRVLRRLLVASGTALALLFLVSGNNAAAADDKKLEITEAGLKQLEAIYKMKDSLTPAQKKLHTSFVVEAKIRNRDPIMQELPALRSGIRYQRDGRVLVDITGEVTFGLINMIETSGGDIEIQIPESNFIRAALPFDKIERLAESRDVKRIWPAIDARRTPVRPERSDSVSGTTTKATNHSEGDIAHGADVARSLYGIDGTGVKVGVISNGVDHLADVQATGDLPPTVTILPGQAGSGDEGTAMLEIIHDLAPGAELFFASGIGSPTVTAANIRALRDSGCHVIVSDVIFDLEAVFQPGEIAQAISEVATQNGVFVFYSAGNSGNMTKGTSGVWEGDFKSKVVPIGDTHDFHNGTNYNTITADDSAVNWFILQWSDADNASGNDYDLTLFNKNLSMSLIVAAQFRMVTTCR